MALGLNWLFPDRPRPGEIYLYRTLKPYPGWRHNGYVGQTRNPLMRDIEHVQGGGRYGQKAKPWADLKPKRYAWRFKAIRNWRLNLIEMLAIWVLLPVYNVTYNLANPRRITTRQARRQREIRDMGAPRWLHFRPGHFVLVALALIALWRVA